MASLSTLSLNVENTLIILETMQFRPNDTFNYMESVHKSPRVDHKISVSRNTGKPEYMVTKLTSEGY